MQLRSVVVAVGEFWPDQCHSATQTPSLPSLPRVEIGENIVSTTALLAWVVQHYWDCIVQWWGVYVLSLPTGRGRKIIWRSLISLEWNKLSQCLKIAANKPSQKQRFQYSKFNHYHMETLWSSKNIIWFILLDISMAASSLGSKKLA